MGTSKDILHEQIYKLETKINSYKRLVSKYKKRSEIFRKNAKFWESEMEGCHSDNLDMVEAIKNAGYNVVTCGQCGKVNVHLFEEKTEYIRCIHCECESEKCDFPDYSY